MAYQMIFQRYEIKYLLTQAQKAAVLKVIEPYMVPDRYGRTTIRSIYFDTDNFRLIRRSIEHPAYKEKLRLRSYSPAEAQDAVFVELKKKYKSVVYKRRLILPQAEAMHCLSAGAPLPVHSQIADEINYFCSYYGGLSPSVFLSYNREAYDTPDSNDFRVTFDDNVLARCQDFSFAQNIYGLPLLEQGMTLMEIKTAGAVPLWMTRCLSENKIFKTSFSKYGTAYRNLIYHNNRQGGTLYA